MHNLEAGGLCKPNPSIYQWENSGKKGLPDLSEVHSYSMAEANIVYMHPDPYLLLFLPHPTDAIK